MVSSRSTRIRKATSKLQEGATQDEISSQIGHIDYALDAPASLTTNPSPSHPSNPQKSRKKPGRKPKAVKVEVHVAAIIPSVDGNAVVKGEDISEVLNTATATIQSSTIEDYITEDEEGKPVNQPRRRAQLKISSQLKKEEKDQKKQQQKSLNYMEFSLTLCDIKTVEFDHLQEGPLRDSQTLLPSGLNLDSPYAIFSLLWTEEMWQILSDNTNAYALKEGAIPRGRDSIGTRLYGDSITMNQRQWTATNPSELKVFVGTLIYMGIHHEGETVDFWYKDLLTGPTHTPVYYISNVRFTQLQ